MGYNWTVKRKAAKEYLKQARGNVCEAARLATGGEVSVSYGYLNDLVSKPEHTPFREAYWQETGEFLNALEVNSQFVISGIVDLAQGGKPDSTKLDALKTLGEKYLQVLKRPKEKVEVSGSIALGHLTEEQLEEVIKFTGGEDD